MEVDPRYLIAKETNFADHEVASGWHAVNLELRSGAGRSRSARLRALRDHLGADGRIDPAHLGAPSDFTVATAIVTTAGLQKLEALVQHAADGESDLLRRFEYAQFLKPPRIRPIAGLALPNGIDGPSKRITSKKVRDVFAVIDHGCPFMHPLLCTQSGGVRSTRVRALWDQQATTAVDARTRPKGFDYGTELSRAQLDAVIRAAAGDEHLAYESLSYEAMRRRESHGAHSLGMLLDDGLRPRGCSRDVHAPDVLFVQLPQGLLCAPNRAVLSRYVIDALIWIESQRAPGERVILSLGGGSSQGPNDGSSIVERALQAFTQWGPGSRGNAKPESAGWRRHRIYIAAGNGHSEKLHATARLSPSAATSFRWRVPPGSELPANVEIWLPSGARGAQARVAIEVLAPDGRPVAQVMPGEVAHWPNARAATVSAASTAWSGEGCTLSLIRVAPTAAGGSRASAPAGDWTIRLTPTAAVKTPVHLFISRLQPSLGFPLRSAQPTFVADARHGVVGASGLGTLQGLATASGVIRVGGVVGTRHDPPAADYSSRGPSRNGAIVGPDLSVRVDDGAVLRGRRSIGNLGGVSFRMDGTSVGAPLAARLHRTPLRAPRPRPKDAKAIGEVLADPRDS